MPIPDPHRHDADGLDEMVAELRQLTEQAAALTTGGEPGSELVLADTVSADAVKDLVARQRAELARTTRELQQRRDALRERLQAEMAAVHSALDPLHRQMKLLEEAVWTVNLYLGRDEQLVTLLDGEPADAATPITVRQMVLSMDEETTIAATEGGIDFGDIDEFDEWITDPAHLEQVLPEPRGVVVLVPRRRGRDYGDPIATAVLNGENKRSYWLIRNGRRLFRMSTDFIVGDRLVPTAEEFRAYFTETRYNHDLRRTERVPLEPGSTAWLRAEEAADARQRHYMRAALILQGLIDRTTVFAPLPAPKVSLLRPDSYDAGHVRLITDAENTLGTGRTPFYDWLTQRNRRLRPGMRVVGAFDSAEFRDLRIGDRSYGGEHERLRPGRAAPPDSSQIHVVEDHDDSTGGLIIRYTRADRVYARDEYGYSHERPARNRASCVLYPGDRFMLPIDLVTLDEIDDYLQARTERHAYLHMLPLLTRVRAAKISEAEAEAPFRRMLAGRLAEAHDIDVSDALHAVDELTLWWKHTNVHYRPLIDDGRTAGIERRAVAEITAEFAARRRAADTAAQHAETDEAVVTLLRTHDPDVMVVARTREGGYLALAPQPRRYPAPLAARGIYATEHAMGKRMSTITTRSWTVPARARADRWTILWHDDTWARWNLAARRTVHLTDPEIDDLLDVVRSAGHDHHTDRWRDGCLTSRRTGTPAVITCVPDTSGRHRLRLYFTPVETDPIPERLLTAPLPSAGCPSVDLAWRRSTANVIKHDLVDYHGERTWRSRIGEDTLPPWHGETVLWTDDAQVAALREHHAAVTDAKNHALTLRDTARQALHAAAREWERRAEEAAHRRFLDDYRTPDLWEGHRKTLTGLRFPHYGDRGLEHLVQRLVEDGHDLTGHTVATAVELLAEPVKVPPATLDLPLSGNPEEPR